MSTHNICFYEEISKIISLLSSNTRLISSFDYNNTPMLYNVIFHGCNNDNFR